MKKYEKEAVEYAKAFSKDWDYAIIAMDAYMAGVRFGAMNKDTLEEQVTLDLLDGTHQLTEATFREWKKQNEWKKTIDKVMEKHHKTFESLALND